MLKSVRYVGLRSLIRNVHWHHALTVATIIVSLGPSSRSDAKSTAYETDIVDLLRASGRVTLKTDVTDESVSSSRNSPRCENGRAGNCATRTQTPNTMRPHTNSRAGRGRRLMGFNSPTQLSSAGQC